MIRSRVQIFINTTTTTITANYFTKHNHESMFFFSLQFSHPSFQFSEDFLCGLLFFVIIDVLKITLGCITLILSSISQMTPKVTVINMFAPISLFFNIRFQNNKYCTHLEIIVG